jgi:antirestriction protein ArdC
LSALKAAGHFFERLQHGAAEPPSFVYAAFARSRRAVGQLVAELGAAFVCTDLALTSDVREDHASYIASLLKVLKEDKRAVFAAASHAQKAADYLNAKQSARQDAKTCPGPTIG